MRLLLSTNLETLFELHRIRGIYRRRLLLKFANFKEGQDKASSLTLPSVPLSKRDANWLWLISKKLSFVFSVISEGSSVNRLLAQRNCYSGKDLMTVSEGIEQRLLFDKSRFRMFLQNLKSGIILKLQYDTSRVCSLFIDLKFTFVSLKLDCIFNFFILLILQIDFSNTYESISLTDNYSIF